MIVNYLVNKGQFDTVTEIIHKVAFTTRIFNNKEIALIHNIFSKKMH